MRTVEEATLAVPYYRNAAMLERQIEEWEAYPKDLRIVLIDDASPEPARPIVENCASPGLLKRLELYRILIDIPWNREEARNLATMHCQTDWLIHVDIDHVLPAASAAALLDFTPDPTHWYRFPRWRCGRADETRRKDAIPVDAEFGAIHPHIDSYLVSHAVYWKAGGYDLTFSGCLGGGAEFLKRLERIAPPLILPAAIALHVFTRSAIKDASDWTLSRDTSEGKRRARAKQKSGDVRLQGVVRSPWERQL